MRTRMGRSLAGWVLLCCLVLPGTVHGERTTSSAVGLALTATPSTGSAPLDVVFNASLTPGSASGTFDWTFGDGASYVVSATGWSSVSHVFPTAGQYRTNVTFSSPSGMAAASLGVTVEVGALSVSILAAPVLGTAPLTVVFHIQVSGGSGTYVSVVWSFGDGSSGSGTEVEYTYPRNGTFLATVNVTDSAGRSAAATQSVDVLAAANPPDSRGELGALDLDLVVGTVVLAAAAAIFAGIRQLVVRRDRSAPPPEGALRETVGPAAPPSRVVPSPEGMEGPSATDLSPSASRRLSERILVHLYWFARSTGESVARPEASQQGMAERLGATQTSLSKALARLQAAGLVEASLAHVPGFPRRVKCYRLTAAGEALARRVQPNWKS
jgi:DNA-binding MarR family transcriptional regulator